MAPDEVKLLKPIPAGCWHCVAAMMQGLLVLCGPTACGASWLIVSIVSAEAAAVSANVAAVAATPMHAKRILPNMIQLLLGCEVSNTCMTGSEINRQFLDDC